MRTFCISPEKLNKWCGQNKGEYTGDFVDGCLLDNFIIACNRGYAFVYEHYLNPWASDYLVKFCQYDDKPAMDNLWKEWDAFTALSSESA